MLEEIAMVEDTPEELVGDLLCEAQFEGSSGTPSLGSAGRIRVTNAAIWKATGAGTTAPATCAGDRRALRLEAFLALVTRWFDRLPTGGAEPDARPPAADQRRKARTKKTEQLQSRWAPRRGLGSDDLYAQSCFNNAMGGA